MLGSKFIPFQQIANFLGINAKDSPENMLDGEWDEASINIFSDPQGAVGSRTGYSAITTASIGSATAWCGFYQFRKSSGTDYYLGGAQNGKIYEYASNAYTELFSGLTITKGADKRFSFFTLDDTVIITCDDNIPLKWTGVGSAVTFATSVTADWGLEWVRYPWLHSTVDPRLLYYGPLGDPDGAYTSFLNFDEDPYELKGACKQGNDMLVFKEWSIFRTQYTGSSPIFTKARVPSKVGTVSHYTLRELPDGRVIFLSPDFNVYMIYGNDIIPVGDNIKKFLKNSVNSRLKYAVAGHSQSRHQYWLSFTYLSTSITNDRTLVMDYSRPYRDNWGKLQYPWFIYSIGANCFAEIYTGGKAWLYHGAYTGKMYQDDTGTNDDGAAFNSIYKSKQFSHGDTTLEKKYSKIMLSFENKGSHNLSVDITCDDNAATQKNILQSMSGGAGYNSLWDVAYWDVDYWSSETDIDIGRDIDRTGKLIQAQFSTTGLNQAWNIFNYTLLAKLLRRAIRTRES